MKQDSQNFFDVRTIVSIVIMAGVFIAWQSYMQRKYPQAYKKAATETVAQNASDKTEVVAGHGDASKAATVPSAGQAPKEEQVFVYDTATVSFSLSSRGMGLRDYRVLNYKDRQGKTVVLGQEDKDAPYPLETRLLGHTEPLSFSIQKVSENLFVGHAHVGDLKITKTLEIVPEKYLLKFKVSASGQDSRFVGLSTVLVQEAESEKKQNFLLPQLEKQEFYLDTVDGHDRVAFKKEDLEKSWTKVKLASIGSQYFTQALLDQSPIMPEAKTALSHKHDSAQILMSYSVLNPGQDLNLDYKAYLGPKSFSLLSQIDPSLAAVVDFGFFSWIARQIFSIMRWFYSLVGNWGLAIICLTLLVRVIVLPLNIYSYRSMKAMQAIQPQIQSLREKYKDDQQKQQLEMMRLMRENKVNPLGGCLPILLQFPIFVALYQVVGHSIELYQAPLGLWIHDLSLKDPYYILPVLMGLTMFIQQKITPNATMDPAQAKVLMMMPLVFTFFMVSLPSGLTLYMLVGAVFSVLQQAYFMRSNKTLSTGAL